MNTVIDIIAGAGLLGTETQSGRWDAEELLNRLFEHYEVVPDDVKRTVPLRRAWLIDESETE